MGFKRHGSRYRARRRAVDILFEAEARDIDPVAIVEDRVMLSHNDTNGVAPVNPYTKQIVAGAAEELDRIDEVIAAHLAEDWTLSRISAVDRAVLRVAVWELLFNEEVPVVTAMVEAVEISSEYSTDDAPAYIHALLDSVVQKIDDARAGVSFLATEAEEEVHQAAEVDAELDADAEADADTEIEIEIDHGDDHTDPVSGEAESHLDNPVDEREDQPDVVAETAEPEATE
ncbi:transcription antitermination factor NusB [Corynebacterium sp. 153RC1]|uniref:transcription antitermination factor NusB n=1 Tax=unclassified Corynebacterium TaxID=2624378 RepID=UPI00211B7DAD|nr:transcription antitermination factor NusB [Corynebacterium sp. 209RC1]MCQ9354594.1 transcription antitermination factor NusB [Corynebacterium sp. 1222RC1]MCQ9357349.1 transcription antitermination factor NusB [Corynebacterium sp. 122RC1]MCQ9357992.1 transcription antitermination factor NusB [Corynebacterium sp. 142RC1]MCQ9360404.1 transcription antitermination factor NusB [Corynebacterium sp. 153RC1]MCQ9363935.1 transcription antitermination factor NusB [Corynebacterium sp. 732RC1]MCQ93653